MKIKVNTLGDKQSFSVEKLFEAAFLVYPRQLA